MLKKIFFLSAFYMLLGVSLNAQVKFGLTLGVNSNRFFEKDKPPRNLVHRSKTGFHGGLLAEIQLRDQCFFEIGLLFAKKGNFADNQVHPEVSMYYKQETTLSYIEVPLNFKYRKNCGRNNNYYLGGGPYVAVGVNGNNEGKVPHQVLYKNDVIFSKEVDQFALFNPEKINLKRIDAGLNFLIGYGFRKKFSIQFDGQLGLANIYPKVPRADEVPESARVLKTRGIGISLNYHLN